MVTTAPTFRQVKDILWREIRHRHKSSIAPLGSYLLPKAPRIEVNEQHFAEGFSTDEPEKMLGYHSKNLLIVVDEAAGVEANTWETIERLATADNNRVLCIGNPGAPAGPFFEACMESELWHTIHLSCLNHPNVTTGVEIIPGAVTRQWVHDRFEEYGGWDAPRFKAFVRGVFPDEGTDTLIPGSWVDRAMSGEVTLPDSGPVTISVDVARFGGDETVIMVFRGNRHLETISYVKRDTMFTAGRVIQLVQKYDSRELIVIVDDVGLGGGVTDRLRELGVHVEAFNAGLKPDYRPGKGYDRRHERFLNLRSQAYWQLREGLRTNQIDLRMDKRLRSQLASHTYKIRSDAVIELETKQQIKDRLGDAVGWGSPDRADALVMAWWYHSRRGFSTTEDRTRPKRTWHQEFDYIVGTG